MPGMWPASGDALMAVCALSAKDEINPGRGMIVVLVVLIVAVKGQEVHCREQAVVKGKDDVITCNRHTSAATIELLPEPTLVLEGLENSHEEIPKS